MASWKKWFVRVLLGSLLVIAILLGVGTAFGWTAMGIAPSGERLSRMESSPQRGEGIFVNPQPLWNDWIGSITGLFDRSEYGAPESIQVATDTKSRLQSPPPPLRVTWLGHSTTLIEIEGRRFLTDPFFGESPSPIPALGPQRWYPPPIDLEDLQPIDAVLISHDHYDHLDHPTIVAMTEWDTIFVTPLGVGAHLEYWGIEASRIVELDWWEETQVKGLRVVATPARHASGRHILDQNRTLWVGFALIGDQKRVMFSGDTGLFDDMKRIGQDLGPFDLVMIEVGAYHAAWPDWHIGPEQAIQGHKMMRGELFMPIHWGMIDLAYHGWTEPIERVWSAASKANVAFVAPLPGEAIDVENPPTPKRWWPEVPWQSATEAPIISTRGGDPTVRYETSF